MTVIYIMLQPRSPIQGRVPCYSTPEDKGCVWKRLHSVLGQNGNISNNLKQENENTAETSL